MNQPLTPITSMLIGGGMRNCTSSKGAVQPPHGLADWHDILAKDPAFQGIPFDGAMFCPPDPEPGRAYRYTITAHTLTRLASVPDDLLARPLRQLLGQALRPHVSPTASLHADALRALVHTHLRQAGQHADVLNAAQWAVVLHCLVQPVEAPLRKRELRTVQYLSDPHSKGIYTRLVQAARVLGNTQEPRIGVVTAASDNPFEEADINVFALRSAGANAIYLPLNGGLLRAMAHATADHAELYYEAYANTGTDQPHWHSCLRFPDYAQQLCAMAANQGEELHRVLASLDGIYFSGGDQARILEAWVQPDSEGELRQASPWLTLLRERFAQGRLLVAGTSAGNHIQGGGLWHGRPVPMLGGGDSYAALQRGFEPGLGAALETPARARVYGHGGLATFAFGVLDSHFSQRCREGRLARATLEYGMDYGFGIDENTALVVHQADANGTTHMAVQGEYGVWVLDARQAQSATDKGTCFRAHGFIAHHLHEGDTLTMDARGDLQVQLSPQRPELQRHPDAQTVAMHQVQDYDSHQFAKLAAHMGRTGAQSAHGDTRHSADGRTQQDKPIFAITLTRDTQTCFRGDDTQLAYSGLRIAFFPLEV
ncbi:hypothetical protein [Rhodoferax aquaticus]|uniref:Cyanophycinase n=1 Tax=Rhodoferax aquaticus TaxID=2527691 RepID=A0A515EKH0_9BURK|nr:hypothetical protein [Rhodoferax aquaticus]QDL53164.1 hypothetical protein EXZ61_02690 [Rhodoferax aquaticus]